MRLAPFGAFSGFGALAFVQDAYTLAAILGAGAFFTGKQLLDREGSKRKELWRAVKENERELGRVAREDRIAAPQMKRQSARRKGAGGAAHLGRDRQTHL